MVDCVVGLEQGLSITLQGKVAQEEQPEVAAEECVAAGDGPAHADKQHRPPCSSSALAAVAALKLDAEVEVKYMMMRQGAFLESLNQSLNAAVDLL